MSRPTDVARALRGSVALLCALGALFLLPSAPAAAEAGGLYVDPQSRAAVAQAQDARVAVLARTPAGIWLTSPTDEVLATAQTHLQRAAAARQRVLLVVYAIPERDCGGHSATVPVTHPQYRQWIRRLARSIAAAPGLSPLVVLEPDSLGMLKDCANQRGRLKTLRQASKRLAGAGARVYLDGGHSAWLPAPIAAQRLAKAGARFARGFATNVSNFRATSEERRYATAIRRSLAQAGVPRQRYLIDTSRNGNPAGVVPGEWCNPLAAKLGKPPRLRKRGALDGLVWVKPPGESDGACRPGDAPAGVWSPDHALRLLGLLPPTA